MEPELPLLKPAPWILMGMLALPAHATEAVLKGEWAGDQLQLVMHAKGGHIEAGCASGDMAGPIKLAADGRFTASGSFQSHQHGPERVDAPTGPATAARFTGEVKHGQMRLEILQAGAAAPEVFNLRAGARIKLISCL